MAKIYSTQEAKARFGEVLRRVRSGERVVISFRGEPIAEVSPYPQRMSASTSGGSASSGRGSWFRLVPERASWVFGRS